MHFEFSILLPLLTLLSNVPVSTKALDTSLRILFCSGFGTPSHTKPLLEYAGKLRERGHDITFASLKEYEKWIRKYNFTYFIANKDMVEMPKDMSQFLAMESDYDDLQGLTQILKLTNQHHVLLYKGFKGWFEKRKAENNLPHVIVADFFATACFGLADEYKVPIINSATTITPFVSGFPPNLNFRNLFEPTWTSKMPIIKRLQQLVQGNFRKFFFFFSAIKELYELEREAQIPQQNAYTLMSKKVMLVNSFYPYTPSALYPTNYHVVGPVMSLNYDPLTDNLKHDLDQLHLNEERVVLIAFGSAAMISNATFLRLYEGVVKALDSGIIHRVYWSAGRSQLHLFDHFNDTRIVISPWVPQFAMLQHPAVQLFITHAGAESSHESMYSGTPMIAIPIFADQPGNAIRIEEMGVGKALHKLFFTSDDIVMAMEKILVKEKEKYQKQVKAVKNIVEKSSSRGLEFAANMVELVGMYGDGMFLEDSYLNIYFGLIVLATVVSIFWVILKIV